MSRRRNQFVAMSKSDFVAWAKQMGMTVRRESRKREGWNDSTATFVVFADGSQCEVADAMKGEKVDWDYAFSKAQKAQTA